MVAKGRKRYVPPPVKRIEQIDDREYKLLDESLEAIAASGGLMSAWASVQAARLDLADHHLEAALLINAGGTKGAIHQPKRSVISRAYYAMYCAARAALSYHENGDRDDHKKLPDWLAKSNLGAQADRERVVSALNKYRNLRNEADYSPFFPTPLGVASKLAIREAKAVLKICRRWFKLTGRTR